MVELRKRPAPKEAGGEVGGGRAKKMARKAVSAGDGVGKKGRGRPAVKKTTKEEEDVEQGSGDVKGGNDGDVEKENSTDEDPVLKKNKEQDDEKTIGDGETTTKNTDDVAIPASTSADTTVENDKTESQGTEKATIPLSSNAVGKSIPDLSSFGGTIKTNSDEDVTFKTLLEKSEKGIVIFTYPKASTPGCTTQACLFRDSYTPLTKAGLSVYGLSTDSPKANTTFVTKQKLPFELLCDAGATLTGAIGLKKGVGKGTLRGVVLVGRDGKVEVWEQAGPKRTLDVVLEWVG